MCAARPHYHYPIHQSQVVASNSAVAVQAAHAAAAANNANAAAMISMSRNFTTHLPTMTAAAAAAPASLIYQDMRCDQCDFR